MRNVILGLMAICFSSGIFAYDYCEGLVEYPEIFKKEIASFQLKIDKDLKDPRLTEKYKKTIPERLQNEKLMCQELVKKHTYWAPTIFNEGVSELIVKESAIMYHEGRSPKELNQARMLLIACYCQLKGHYK
jgi:hypothetical protein